MPTNYTRLMKLARREFEREADQPDQPPKQGPFKGKRVRLRTFSRDWDLKRGSAARLMGVLLQEDSATLQARVCESERATQDYENAVEWFAREAQTLRRTATMHDTVSSRLRAVIDRCLASRAAAVQGGAAQPTG